MPHINVIVDGEGAWPDLPKKIRAGKVVQLGEDAEISLAALGHGMASGRASVMWRFDMPSGRVVLVEMSLRSLYNGVQMIVAKHGEDFMRAPNDQLSLRIAMASRELLKQLIEARTRLGEGVTIDMTEADKEWERHQRMREVLVQARHALEDELGLSDDLRQAIDTVLA